MSEDAKLSAAVGRKLNRKDVPGKEPGTVIVPGARPKFALTEVSSGANTLAGNPHGDPWKSQGERELSSRTVIHKNASLEDVATDQHE